MLSVNGQPLVHVDHYDAVEVLKRSGYKLVFVVTREVPRLVPVTTKVGQRVSAKYRNSRWFAPMRLCVPPFGFLSSCELGEQFSLNVVGVYEYIYAWILPKAFRFCPPTVRNNMPTCMRLEQHEHCLM